MIRDVQRVWSPNGWRSRGGSTPRPWCWSAPPSGATGTTPLPSACRRPRWPVARRASWPRSCASGCWAIPGGRLVEEVEVAGPGFPQLPPGPRRLRPPAASVLAEGDGVGRGEREQPLHILLEFVSVNPNGPLHVGHGRYAAYGDALRPAARLQRAPGDAPSSTSTTTAGRWTASAAAWPPATPSPSASTCRCPPTATRGTTSPTSPASRLRARGGRPAGVAGRGRAGKRPRTTRACDEADRGRRPWRFFRSRGCAADARRDAGRAGGLRGGVRLLVQRDHAARGRRARAGRSTDLLETGEAFREGDAVWLRTTSRGDDKDRVLIRSNGQPTYFAADIAYHEDKLERGFDHLINIWGADHHGYVPRMKAAVEILAGTAGHAGGHHRAAGQPAGGGRAPADVHPPGGDGHPGASWSRPSAWTPPVSSW